MNRFLAPALLLGLSSPLAAQTLTINGARLTVQAGTTLAVPDSLLNGSGSQLSNAGTVQVGRTLNNAGAFTSTGQLRFSGAARQRLVPGGASLAQMELTNTGAAGNNVLLVTDDLLVTGQLQLTSGLVRTPAAKTISLPAGANLVGEAAGRYVQGNLRLTRTGVSGPTDFGHGVWLDATGQNLGEVSVTRTAGLQTAGVSYGTNLGSSTKSIDRIWTISSSQSPTAAVPLRLSWPADDDNGLVDFTQAQLWRQASSATAWEMAGTRTDATAHTISTSVTGFGRLTVSNAANPLPVELISFTAERRGPDALLRWATASEKNSAFFAVESSPDGRTFSPLGQVRSHGNTTQRHDYQFTDPNLTRYAVGTVYYRLRQVDQDGTALYSPVRTLAAPAAPGLTVQAWPNPFRNEVVRVSLHTEQAGPVTVALTDAVGRTLFTHEAQALPGANTLELPQTARLTEGVYLLRVRQGGQQRVLKIVQR